MDKILTLERKRRDLRERLRDSGRNSLKDESLTKYKKPESIYLNAVRHDSNTLYVVLTNTIGPDFLPVLAGYFYTQI